MLLPQQLWNDLESSSHDLAPVLAKSKLTVKIKVVCVRVYVPVCLPLWLVHVLVPQDLVQHPVEDVEEEEGQREAGPRNSVNLFGPVDEQLPHLLRALASRDRCVLIGPGRGCRGRVVDLGLGVLAVAGSGGHGDCGGLTAVVHLAFLRKREERSERQKVCYFSAREVSY